MHKRTLVACHFECKRLESKMLKCVLIYLWLYIGIYCAIEAGDADEHVHIKLHMPKSGVRKTVHHHHTRHKKNPPNYGPPPNAHAHTSSGLDSGPGITHSHIYHESPHNYLTATGGGQQTTASHHLQHSHHHQHGKKQPSLSSAAVTHLQPIGSSGGGAGHHQDLIDTEFYTNEEGPTTGEGATNADFMLNEYLTANFAAFPQPHTFETEIMSPQTNAELAYHQSQRAVRDGQQQQHYPHHHYSSSSSSATSQQLHNNYHQPYYESTAAADVVATQHELEDEDNEILGRTAYPMDDTEWTTQQHSKPYRGLSTVKAMKNEHLLKYIMQQEQQPRPSFPYQPEITNTAAAASKYRGDDKLHTMSAGGEERDDAVLEAMKAYEDMDMTRGATTYSDEGGPRGGYSAGAGIKALTVDDIWSQLQRTYLSKYTPQAQPVTTTDGGEEFVPSAGSKKQKRNSQKLKTRKPHHHHPLHSVRAATPTSFPAIRNLNYENNYYSQEHPVKQSSFYDSHHHQKPSHSVSYSSAFKPYSSLGSLPSTSSSPDLDADLFETRTNAAATRPYHKFNTAIVLDEPVEDESSSSNSFDEDETGGLGYSSDNIDDDRPHAGEDISSEESVFSSIHKKYGNNRSHRHSHGSVAYGNVNLNNPPFNYHDLYASYSTPIAATIATHTLPAAVVSTYHPNSYSALHAATSSGSSGQQSPHHTDNSANHESTSYQWREQQHYPASLYQGYHTTSPAASSSSSSSQQQQNHNRPQHQKLLQPYHPKATLASTLSSSSLSLGQHHPLTSSTSSSSSPAFAENEFTTAVKHSSAQQQHRYKKRKNRLKSKRNRIVVT